MEYAVGHVKRTTVTGGRFFLFHGLNQSFTFPDA
jgi:hypothetical protein